MSETEVSKGKAAKESRRFLAVHESLKSPTWADSCSRISKKAFLFTAFPDGETRKTPCKVIQKTQEISYQNKEIRSTFYEGQTMKKKGDAAKMKALTYNS